MEPTTMEPTTMEPTTMESTTMEPSTSTTMELTTSATLEHTTSTTVEPSTSTTMEPATNTTFEPSTSTTMEPTTSTTMEQTPSTTMEPTTTSTMKPTKSTTMEPITSTTMESTTSSIMEPTTFEMDIGSEISCDNTVIAQCIVNSIGASPFYSQMLEASTTGVFPQLSSIELEELCMSVGALDTCLEVETQGCTGAHLLQYTSLRHTFNYVCGSGKQAFLQTAECFAEPDIVTNTQACLMEPTQEISSLVSIIAFSPDLFLESQRLCSLLQTTTYCFVNAASNHCSREQAVSVLRYMSNVIEPTRRFFACLLDEITLPPVVEDMTTEWTTTEPAPTTEKTTSAEVTTTEPAPTSEKTTTAESTTTEPAPTTEKTTSEEATTTEPASTSKKTTTAESTTTEPASTTEKTTSEEATTTEPASTSEKTISEEATTTEKHTTTEQPMTTKDVSTTEQATTTVESIKTDQTMTTGQSTTTERSTTTEDITTSTLNPFITSPETTTASMPMDEPKLCFNCRYHGRFDFKKEEIAEKVDQYCIANGYRGFCPIDTCRCIDPDTEVLVPVCEVRGLYRRVAGYKEWCERMCHQGYCKIDPCDCHMEPRRSDNQLSPA
ncbi:mucin-5AC-like [Mizuhopecten yessoensis]|nr:mucin-5AC-like [Mizuhopecten yessoensis]